ncbi:hypothetical protein DL240_16650 [Lujinxingia litoralis]|uniref:Kazal-like domain-containing protein n=1 Tax=Lujinxingia litoralis TaxID=2211119 RepID=A0A328C7B1_9DELT|nr:DUF6184 family natural product biosynthesis lipoprotein [Lujinxingia litoralis]RAL20434.1 hypothetical protein DL240_16650 [Lujinxingia litoralis]
MRTTGWLNLFVVLAVALSQFACGEPTREDYRDEAAETFCDRSDDCGNVGEGRTYSSYSDCLVEKKADFNDVWPADQCSGDRIIESQFDRCLDRIKVSACDGSWLDQLSTLNECRAGNVCAN